MPAFARRTFLIEPRRLRRGARHPALADAPEAPADRVLDTRLPALELEGDPGERRPARLRGHRAAGCRGRDGPAEGPGAFGLASRRDAEGSGGARDRDQRSRRIVAHAREGQARPRQAARRGTPLHRPGAGALGPVRQDVRGQAATRRAEGRGDEAGRRGLPADGRVCEDGGCHRDHRVARRLHALGRPRADPEERRLTELRAALGRAPYVRRRPGGARRHLEAARLAGAPHPPEGLGARRDREALRPHRDRPGAGEGAGAGAGHGRLQGLLLLRVGEEVAPGDRGAGESRSRTTRRPCASTWPRQE